MSSKAFVGILPIVIFLFSSPVHHNHREKCRWQVQTALANPFSFGRIFATNHSHGCGGRPLLSSDATVRFGPVQRTLCPNLELDLWFGSSRLVNLGLDLEGPVQQVRFGKSIGSNLEPQIFCINIAEKWCKYYLVNFSRSGMS